MAAMAGFYIGLLRPCRIHTLDDDGLSRETYQVERARKPKERKKERELEGEKKKKDVERNGWMDGRTDGRMDGRRREKMKKKENGNCLATYYTNSTTIIFSPVRPEHLDTFF